MNGAQLKSQPTINPRWVLGALQQRGLVPEPTLAALTEAIAMLDGEAVEVLRGRVSRLKAGTEKDGEMALVAEWCEYLRDSDQLGDGQAAANDRAQQARSDEAPQSRSARRGQAFEPSHHVYGAKAALCVESVRVEPTSEGAGIDGYSTLQLEMAPMLTRNRYDWEHKIIFRLTQREIALFAAALLGWCKKLEFKGHGPSNDKILEIDDQGAHLFIKLRQGRKAYALPMGGDEIFPVSAMVLKTLGLNAPHLDSQTLVQLAKRAGDMYGRATAAHGSGQ